MLETGRWLRIWRCAAAILVVCAGTFSSSALLAQDRSYEEPINAALQQMLDAWNRDDLDAHIAPYADSATWMTANGLLRGKDAIRASLVRSFQREGKLAGDLRFSDTEFHPLDANAVMTTAAFHLTNLPSGREINGRSTLIWVKRAGKWQIIHDHSS